MSSASARLGAGQAGTPAPATRPRHQRSPLNRWRAAAQGDTNIFELITRTRNIFGSVDCVYS